ncbi:MAG TPA: LCP family protein, partial [Nitrolancea sp.]|nr:LCP family protein [Nitrolancea sp.]
MRHRSRRLQIHPRYAGGGTARRLSAAEIRRLRSDTSTPERPATPRLSAAAVRQSRHTVPPLISPPPSAPPLPLVPVTAHRRFRWRLVLIGIPCVLLLSVLVVGGDIAWHAHNAYSQIFVPPPPQPVLTANAAGTPELVLNPTHSAGTPESAINPTPAAPAPTPFPDWTGSGRVNVLLLGADTNQARQATGEPALSDTIIIVSIDPVTKQVGIMSLPRDMQVTIPGVGLNKINAAYSIGSTSSLTGPGLVQATIEYNFHIHIDYFAVVDFAGFQKIINTMGGVLVDVPAPIKDNAYPGEQFNYTR